MFYVKIVRYAPTPEKWSQDEHQSHLWPDILEVDLTIFEARRFAVYVPDERTGKLEDTYFKPHFKCTLETGCKVDVELSREFNEVFIMNDRGKTIEKHEWAHQYLATVAEL